MYANSSVVLEVTGKPAVVSYGFVAPSSFGKTTLQLTSTRVIEKTRKVIATRHCEVPLSSIDSVEIHEDGNPIWLVLGLSTLFLFGVGIIFIIFYLFVGKCKYLIIRSGNNAQAMAFSGSSGMEKSRHFMAEVLRLVEESNRSEQNLLFRSTSTS